MISQTNVERVRDVILTLYACKKYDKKPGRLQLQKLIYLLDCLVLSLRIYSTKKGHKTYLRGPYDAKIQNSMDILVFWDLAEVSNIQINERSIMCNYSISYSGIAFSNSLISASELIKKRSELIFGIVDSLVKRNLFNKIKELVYSEPTYSYMNKQGYEQRIDLGDYERNLSAQIISLMERTYKDEITGLTVEFITDFLIDFLNESYHYSNLEGV